MTGCRSAANFPESHAVADNHIRLGLMYLNQGDAERAKRQLLLGLQQDPTWPIAQDAMAFYLETVGEDAAAEQYYKRALSLSPSSPEAHNNYGSFLCRNNRYVEAIEQFKRAIADPNYLHIGQAYENAGFCALKIPDLLQAQSYLQKAIQQNPQSALAYLGLAQIAFMQKNYALAQTYFNGYNRFATTASVEAIKLGIQLAQQEQDAAALSRYTLMLKTHSTENPNLTESYP